MLAPFWYCVYGFHTKNTSKTRRNARPLSSTFATKIVVFPSIWASFPLPGAPLEPPGPEVGPQVDFCMIFKRPGGGFGSPGPLAPIWHQKITLWPPKSDLWGTFGALLAHLGASLAPLWPQSARKKATWDCSHNPTKNIEKPGSRNKGSVAEADWCGAQVKVPILRKASLNTGENANPAEWRKPGPLGKGNY